MRPVFSLAPLFPLLVPSKLNPPPSLLPLSLSLRLATLAGSLAFFLNEHHDRTAPAPGYSLSALIDWKWPRAERKTAAISWPKRKVDESEAGLAAGEEEARVLREMLREVEGKGGERS